MLRTYTPQDLAAIISIDIPGSSRAPLSKMSSYSYVHEHLLLMTGLI